MSNEVNDNSFRINMLAEIKKIQEEIKEIAKEIQEESNKINR